MRNEPVGILGGVGPMATVYFMQRVLEMTDAGRDQDHVDMLVWNHASIPDRTAYIVGDSDESPGPVMAQDARELERAGAKFIALPCNTAQAFQDEVAAAVTIPVIDIVAVTVEAAKAAVPGLTTLGILATDGTLRAETYHRAAEAAGLTPIAPDDVVQKDVMSMIYDGVKAGMPVSRDRFDAAVEHLRTKGAGAIVLGCTELSILQTDLKVDEPDVVDSLDALAARTVVLAGGRLR
ncbi:putative aspartate racemase [Janibacter sp. HTCC2649]|uniref:aspartate/glutamate racemase family protein n=1 Tax=Janibacter sp. HTCC2649 TaxID=313589 RepID=UPI00006711A9|nr:amino acid racemase [Janibacter sp. HTCC2649]EAP97051.1 putative aspartate racemase [Janibacter sp. HTCC2649]